MESREVLHKNKMNNLLKLISGGENERLEFKESLKLKEEICQAVSAFSNAYKRVEKFERLEVWEYSITALREAIVNAICHRDYESTGNVQVRIFDDRIEVWNPGRLPDPLTLEDLKERHTSIPRNPLIAKCFFLINSKFRIIYPEISDRTLRKDLEDIVKAGIMKPVGEKRGRKYVLK